MLVNVNCPVEVLSICMGFDENGDAAAAVELLNCASIEQAAITLSLTFCAEGDATKQTANRTLGEIFLEPGYSQVFLLPLPEGTDETSVECKVDSVEFADGEVWESIYEDCATVPETELLSRGSASQLRAVAGEPAVCYAMEGEEGIWRCICGRWNAKADGQCLVCKREKEAVLSAYTEESFAQHVPAAKAAPREKRKRNPSLLLIILYLLLAAVCAFGALRLRQYRFNKTSGAGLMPTSQAITTFESI